MTKTVLNNKQEAQESGYIFPYHWTKDSLTSDGRLYFGYLRLASKVLEHMDYSVKILDAGCGDARFLQLLLEKGFKNIHGIDYSERAVAFARLLLPDVTFVIEDLADPSRNDSEYDVIFFIETLEHIIPTDIPSVLNGLSSKLKKGGSLVVTVPSLYGGAPAQDSKHYQHFTIESLEKTLGEHFIVEKIVGQDYIPLHPLKLLYRLFDNAWIDIRPARRWYNKKVWAHHFNECEPKDARRLVAYCKK